MLYSRVTEMEPLFPTQGKERLDDLAFELGQKSAALGHAVHPITRKGIVEVVRAINSYYSNLIEGHNTHPVDIEKAMRKDFSQDPAKRARQLESYAHIEVQKLIERRLAAEVDVDVTSEEFISWVHKEFYDRMPPEYLQVKTPQGEVVLLSPGAIRDREVEVGHHLAPRADSLERFLKRFNNVYNPKKLHGTTKVIAVAAAHHRLAWIHPFLDGNGRVTRLVTHAFLTSCGIDGHGLWTVSRGLARNRDGYLQALSGADAHRKGDYDGRGNLSDSGLAAFCGFFLATAIDQVQYMASLLDLDMMQERILRYVGRQASLGILRPECGLVLRDVFLRGEVTRGEAMRIASLPERSARRHVLSPLLQMGLLVSDSERGPVRLGFPTTVVGYFFPRLYPEGVEATMPELKGT